MDLFLPLTIVGLRIGGCGEQGVHKVGMTAGFMERKVHTHRRCANRVKIVFR